MKSKKAKGIKTFLPSSYIAMEGSRADWFKVSLEPGNCYQEYKELPEIAVYDSKRWFKMSFNSDSNYAVYKESKGYKYHERYTVY